MEHVVNRLKEIIYQKTHDKWGDCLLDKSEHFLEDLTVLISQAVKRCDMEFLAASGKSALECGACMTMVIIIGKYVVSVNLGNCKAYIVTGGRVTKLTSDHYPVYICHFLGFLSILEVFVGLEQN